MIYLTGDLHGTGGLERFKRKNFPDGWNLTKQDTVVVLGDFGIPWRMDGSDRYALEWLDKEAPWTTVFVDGNHENFSLLKQFSKRKWNGGAVHSLNRSVLHLMRGEIYMIDGFTFLAAGGATSIDMIYRVPYQSWWPDESWGSRDITNIMNSTIDNSIDYVLAHTAPYSIISQLVDTKSFVDPISKTMDEIQIPFNKIWYFGHIHFNASFNNGRYVSLFKNIVPLNTD